MQEDMNAIKEQIESHGKATQRVFVGERFLSSTAVFPVSTALPSETRFFANSTLGENFETDKFPANEVAYDILGISIEHNLQFVAANVPDAGVGRSVQRVFEHLTVVSIRHRERDGAFRGPLSALVPWVGITSGQAFAMERKTNSFFKFMKPMAVGALQKFDIRAKWPTGFTTLANTAAQTTIIPSAGLASNQGYSVTMHLHVAMYTEVN